MQITWSCVPKIGKRGRLKGVRWMDKRESNFTYLFFTFSYYLFIHMLSLMVQPHLLKLLLPPTSLIYMGLLSAFFNGPHLILIRSLSTTQQCYVWIEVKIKKNEKKVRRKILSLLIVIKVLNCSYGCNSNVFCTIMSVTLKIYYEILFYSQKNNKK